VREASYALGKTRILSPESVTAMTKVQTGDLKAGFTVGMGWGLGWGVVKKPTGVTEMLSEGTFGHGGVGSSYCWADPESGVSFAYLTNNRVPDPWHSERMDRISELRVINTLCNATTAQQAAVQELAPQVDVINFTPVNEKASGPTITRARWGKPPGW